jgi:plasmid stability protein
MAILQVRDLDDRLYNYLKTSARLQNRSISQTVITILENYLTSSTKTGDNATMEFLSMTGAWKDDRAADEMVKDIRKNRKNSKRFGEGNGVFD